MLKLSVLKRWRYEVVVNLALEIYDMVVYKICLNTKIEVHIKKFKLVKPIKRGIVIGMVRSV